MIDVPQYTVHLWAAEIDDARDIMSCGFIVFFNDNGSITNVNSDFVILSDDHSIVSLQVTCPECLHVIKMCNCTECTQFRARLS